VALLYIYSRLTKQADIAKVLTFYEARRIAVNVAKLPELLPVKARADLAHSLSAGEGDTCPTVPRPSDGRKR